jgi:hypothetical protein
LTFHKRITLRRVEKFSHTFQDHALSDATDIPTSEFEENPNLYYYKRQEACSGMILISNYTKLNKLVHELLGGDGHMEMS